MSNGGPAARERVLCMRISETGYQHLAVRAEEEGLVRNDGKPNRSELVRRMLAYAATHMPKGWAP